jgi:hypothetical protein
VILGAGLLVLVGLGLFVGGVLTGSTALYWVCVGACAVAAVLLVASRRSAPAPAARLPATASTAKEKPAPVEDSADAPPRTDSRTRITPAPADEPADASTGAPASTHRSHRAPDLADAGSHHAVPENMREPPVEEVEVTDLLLVVDLTDEVLVVDEHPRYHLDGCRYLRGKETIPLPLDEARTDGFTPCALCAPDRHLADRERARKAARGD